MSCRAGECGTVCAPKELDNQSGARIGGRPGDQILNLMSCGAGEFDNQSGKQLIGSWVSRVYLHHMQSRLDLASEPGLRQPLGVPFLGCVLLALQIPRSPDSALSVHSAVQILQILQIPRFLSIPQCSLCAACVSLARLVCHIPCFPCIAQTRSATTGLDLMTTMRRSLPVRRQVGTQREGIKRK